MTVLKYRDASGIQTLLDVTTMQNDVSGLKTMVSNLQSTVNALNAATNWMELATNCYYKKVGKLCFIQCDYITLSASTWNKLGTLPAGYRPVVTGLTGDFTNLSFPASLRGADNVGIMNVEVDGSVSMYATIASSYWSSFAVFHCA
jgi:hypothetical protein